MIKKFNEFKKTFEASPAVKPKIAPTKEEEKAPAKNPAKPPKPKKSPAPKNLKESNSKAASDTAEAILDLVGEYVDNFDATELRRELFAPIEDAINIATKYVSDKSGSAESEQFRSKAYELFV